VTSSYYHRKRHSPKSVCESFTRTYIQSPAWIGYRGAGPAPRKAIGRLTDGLLASFDCCMAPTSAMMRRVDYPAQRNDHKYDGLRSDRVTKGIRHNDVTLILQPAQAVATELSVPRLEIVVSRESGSVCRR